MKEGNFDENLLFRVFSNFTATNLLVDGALNRISLSVLNPEKKMSLMLLLF